VRAARSASPTATLRRAPPDGSVFESADTSYVFSGPRIDDAGGVAFVGSFGVAPDATELGVFAPDVRGRTTLRLATGAPAPGLPGSVLNGLRIAAKVANGGWIVAASRTEPADPQDGCPCEVIYRIDPTGPPRLIATTGDPVVGAPGGHLVSAALAVVDPSGTQVVLAGTVGGLRPDPMYDRRALVYASLPEPEGSSEAALALAALGGVAAARRRRRPLHGERLVAQPARLPDPAHELRPRGHR
jgi:MYXO-CTERM domain-containing protein